MDRLETGTERGRPRAGERARRGLEVAANLVILGLGAALLWLFVHRQTSPERTGSAALAPGQALQGYDIAWGESRATVVLALSSECRYCAASVPFYRKLVASARAHGAAVVALLPQEPARARSYLHDAALEVTAVGMLRSGLGVSGVPTLLLVNQRGRLDHAWTGKLEPEQEAQVLDSLARLAAPPPRGATDVSPQTREEE